MKPIIKFTYLISSLFAVVALLIHLLTPRQDIDFLKQNRVWKHRGGIPQNTLEGINSSIREGYRGFEIDVIKEGTSLVLAHDSSEAKSSKEDLETILKRIKTDKLNLWIDYKKGSILHNYSFAKDVSYLLKKHELNEKVFVETKDFATFIFLRLNSVPTSFWFQPRKNFNSLFSFIYKILAYGLGTSHISYDYNNRDAMKEELTSFPHLVFTVKNKKELTLLCKDDIAVILTDIPFAEIPKDCF